MLQSIKQLYGSELGASDGEIGHVKDFYFDDRKWAVRYVVADTGAWLLGRKVLISPHAFGALQDAGKVLRVKLTRKQLENSPSIDSHKPVSRQYEEEYHRYYGWPGYWQGPEMWGLSCTLIAELPPAAIPHKPDAVNGTPAERGDMHMRSTQAVNGYHLRTRDGMIGHVCDFMLNGENWAIEQLVIRVGHRLSGKEVRVPVSKVSRVSYEESTVFVDATTEAIEHSPAHDLSPHVAVR